MPRLAMPSFEAFSLMSFRWYLGIMDIIGGVKVLTNTLTLMVATPVVVLFFSFMISWTVVRTKAKGRTLLDTLAMLPHAIPGLGFAFALTILAILATKWVPWLPLYQTVGLIVLANVVNRLSYATRITNAALLQVGQELEESAQVCGARRLGTMWWVVAPLIRPSLLFGGVWTGLLVFREISMALLLSGPNNQVLAVRIWHHWENGRLSEASALGVLMVILMGVLIFAIQRIGGLRLGSDVRQHEGVGQGTKGA
jgi:iron(III) transport system permease protein